MSDERGPAPLSYPLPPDEEGRLAALQETGALDSSNDPELDEIAQIAAGLLDMPVALVNLIDRDQVIFKARVGFDEKSAPRGLPFCAHAIVSTEPLVLPDLTQDKRFQRSPLVTGGPHFRFYAGVPLTLSDGHSVGTLCVLDRQPKQPTAEQIQRLRVLARSAARFLESRRLVTRLAHEVEERRCAEDKANKALALLHRELDDAEAFVRTVLPSSTDFSGIFHWLFRPSRSLGGDGLGCSRIGEHLMAFHVMDVCGHGIASALLSVAVMFALRARALTEVDFASPSSVLAGLNRAFPSAAYHGLHFTMVYGVLDTRTGQLRYATAGHPAPLLGRPGQPLTELPCETGPLLGVCPEATWPESLVSLAPGDQLFAFSDGACELVQSSGELLPFEAFVQAFERARQQPDPLAALLAFSQRTAGCIELDDDVSLLQLTVPSPG